MDIRDRVAQLQLIRSVPQNIDPEQKLRAGFSAQQVAQVFPDAVVEIDGYLFIKNDVLGGYIQAARAELNSSRIQEKCQ